MENKIKAQLLEAKEMKKGIVVKLIVPLNSFKLKDLAFGNKDLSICIEDKQTLSEFLKKNSEGQ